MEIDKGVLLRAIKYANEKLGFSYRGSDLDNVQPFITSDDWLKLVNNPWTLLVRAYYDAAMEVHQRETITPN